MQVARLCYQSTPLNKQISWISTELKLIVILGGKQPCVEIEVRWPEPCFDLSCPLTCSLTLWTPGCHFILLRSHIPPKAGRPASWYPLFELLSLPPAIWHPGDPSSLWVVWLTLGAAALWAGIRPAVLHVEMERTPVVFDAIYNPGERGEEEGDRS